MDYGISKKDKVFTIGKSKRKKKSLSFFGKPRKKNKRDKYFSI